MSQRSVAGNADELAVAAKRAYTQPMFFDGVENWSTSSPLCARDAAGRSATKTSAAEAVAMRFIALTLEAEVRAETLDLVHVQVAGPVQRAHDEVLGHVVGQERRRKRRRARRRRVRRTGEVLAAGHVRIVDLVDDLALRRDVVRSGFPLQE